MRLEQGKPQLWRLAAAERRPEDPMATFQDVARRRHRSTTDLHRENDLSDEELGRDPLREPAPPRAT